MDTDPNSFMPESLNVIDNILEYYPKPYYRVSTMSLPDAVLNFLDPEFVRFSPNGKLKVGKKLGN
jgi:hypothetical protein